MSVVAVVGLGYVGLPLAVEFGKKGRTIGFDLSARKIASYKEGAANPDKLIDAFTRAIPLGRIGQPEDLPGAILFFASADAAYVTGQVISVSGGLTMAG